MKYFEKMKPLEFLAEDQIERIHKETLYLLEKVGIKVFSKKLLKKIKNAGVKVDGEIVRFCKNDVEDALKSVKKEFTLYGLNDKKNIIIDKFNKFIVGTTNCTKYYDFKNNILRDSTYKDLVDFTKIIEDCDLIERTGPACAVTDVQQENQMFLSAKGLLLNTTKPIELAPHNTKELEIYLEINEIVSGRKNSISRPRFDIVISTISPLLFDNDSADNLMLSVKNGLPIVAAPCPLGGGTSPFTVAGTILLTNVEALFILVCTQILELGTKFIRGGASSAMDLRNASVAYGSAERALMQVANGQLARWYGLPGYTPTGSVDAWNIDVQSGLQKMLAYFTRTFSLSNFFAIVGSTNNGLAASCEQILIDLEMVKMCLRIADGINFDDDALAVDAIERVGHGGNYLIDEHTIKWLKTGKEHVYMDLVNIDGPLGSNMLEKAHKRVMEILDNSKPIFKDKIVEEVNKYIRTRMN